VESLFALHYLHIQTNSYLQHCSALLPVGGRLFVASFTKPHFNLTVCPENTPTQFRTLGL